MRILWEYVSSVRENKREVFFRIETVQGEYAQVDWANCGTVQIGNAVRKLSCFVMVLSYSRMMYLEFTLSQCLEDFLRCHINA
ncbi:MAG: transposase, partial [Elusimicrobia bacterium CG_4_10_14_3_um_filter_49_12_50_7]